MRSSMRYPPHRHDAITMRSCEAGGKCDFASNNEGEQECEKCGYIKTLNIEENRASAQIPDGAAGPSTSPKKDYIGAPLSKSGKRISRLTKYYDRREDRTAMQKRAELIIERIHTDPSLVKLRKETLKKVLEKKRELMLKKANIPLAPSGRGEEANAVSIAFAVEALHRKMSLGPGAGGVSEMIELMRKVLPNTEYPDLLDRVGEDNIRRYLSRDIRLAGRLVDFRAGDPNRALFQTFQTSLREGYRYAVIESGLEESSNGEWDDFMNWYESQDTSEIVTKIPAAQSAQDNTVTELLYKFLDCTRPELLEALGQPRKKRTDSGMKPAAGLCEMWAKGRSGYVD